MAIKLDKTKLIKSLAAKNKLVPHLENYIGKNGDFAWTYKYSPKEGDDAWHPSGHCTPSLHDLYLDATATEREARGGPILKAFQVGHFWHQYLQEVAVRADLCAPEAVERRGKKGWGHLDIEDCFYPFHWVTGAGDIAPCIVPGHGEYLVDFKTMGNHDYRRNDMPEWAADKYECQINIYMELFDLEKGLIVGVQKDSPHEMKEFEYHRNQELIDAIFAKWQLVSVCLDAGVIPPEGEEVHLPLRGAVK